MFEHSARKYLNNLNHQYYSLIYRAIQQLQTDFSTEMGSLGTNHVVTDRLSCGAQIRRIFHERLAYKNNEIDFAIL